MRFEVEGAAAAAASPIVAQFGVGISTDAALGIVLLLTPVVAAAAWLKRSTTSSVSDAFIPLEGST